jgi:hypothetical protein
MQEQQAAMEGARGLECRGTVTVYSITDNASELSLEWSDGKESLCLLVCASNEAVHRALKNVTRKKEVIRLAARTHVCRSLTK